MFDRSALVGIGRTEYSRNSGRSTKAMAADACRAAIADAGLSPTDVDGILCFQANDSTFAHAVAKAVGMERVHVAVDLLGGGNVVASLIATAAAAVETGQCTTAVVYRSLNGRSGHRFGTAVGPMTLGGDDQFRGPQGWIVPPMWFAMWARRHQHTYGTTSEDLGHAAINNRNHAMANDHAVARDKLTMDDYLASRWIVEPLRLYDCSFEVDGAAAVVITSLDRARDLPQPPVRLLGAVDSHAQGASWEQWEDPTTMFSAVTATGLAERTGLGPSDYDLACIYDCFSYTLMTVTEDFGFCGKGEAGAFFAEGRGTYGGDVVINPHGGLLSEGYIHGMNHVYEAVLQLRGQAGSRQVEGAETALVTAGGGPYGGAFACAVDR